MRDWSIIILLKIMEGSLSYEDLSSEEFIQAGVPQALEIMENLEHHKSSMHEKNHGF